MPKETSKTSISAVQPTDSVSPKQTAAEDLQEHLEDMVVYKIKPIEALKWYFKVKCLKDPVEKLPPSVDVILQWTVIIAGTVPSLLLMP